MLTIYDLTQGALDEFQDWFKSAPDASESDVYECIADIADSGVPYSTQQVLELASSNLRLACTEPSIGPVFGEPTPVNLLMANIYEYIRDELCKWYDTYKQK